ncbi:MAG TPA: L,D-transpeptidase [Candidatus Polarisedimenticolia bacterium]|jgi:L,D-transpeptidase YbiS|nr:L,D-transpeptidase [Candidatus Polarisedimenticolia bacterium]
MPLLVLAGFVLLAGGLILRLRQERLHPGAADPTPLDAADQKEFRALEKRAAALESQIAALRPKGTYVIIDTGRNLLTLVKNDRPALEAVCSTGSGRALSDPVKKRLWVFDTPRGEFDIRAKHPNPVWIKPDWAFLEIGEPIPRDLAARLAPTELGDYAMDLGDGYLIHGTLYERALGLSITHGCVRLGARDLDMVYHSIRIGTPVYIF